MLLPSLLSASSVVLALLPSTFAAPHVTTRQTSSTACNNSPELCSRAYNSITHLGAHDVAFLRDSTTSFSTAGNQFYNATVALSAGVRLLQAQIHSFNGALKLCHTSCGLLDGGTLEDWLKDIKVWMDANTNEVVTLLLVNSDDNSTAAIGSAFTGSGISKYGYTPASTSAPVAVWPTLQTLITANTRLVTFVASLPAADVTYPYLLSEFDYVFETAFLVTSVTGFNCSVDRPSSLVSSGGASAVSAGYLGLANHFLDTAGIINVPDITNIATTNSPSSNSSSTLGTQLSLCKTQWGTQPVFVLVDFFNVANPLKAVDEMNGIAASVTGRTTVSTGILTADSTSSNAAARLMDGFGRVTPVKVAAMALVGLAGMNFLWL